MDKSQGPQANLYAIIGQQQVKIEMLTLQLKAVIEQLETLTKEKENDDPKSDEKSS